MIRCTHCGARLRDDSSFCETCGPSPATSRRASVCSWCGAGIGTDELSCPKCGAAVNVHGISSRSGWQKLPKRKDMAKLQLGKSSCQIAGSYVPVADMNLAAGDGIYFTHHVLLWNDPGVEITTMPLKGIWKRFRAGLPLVMCQARGPGHIALSHDDPGEMIAVPLQPGQQVHVREHVFLTATANVAYDWFQTDVWYRVPLERKGWANYPLGVYMDIFRANDTPGLLLLHTGGDVFIRDLAAGQEILVKPTALVFKDPAVRMHLHFERRELPSNLRRTWGDKFVWLRVIGPGRVAVRTVFYDIAAEHRTITEHSYATKESW